MTTPSIPITRAPTQVAVKAIFDFMHGRLRVVAQQGVERHDDARGTETTLAPCQKGRGERRWFCQLNGRYMGTHGRPICTMKFSQTSLDRVQCGSCASQPLNSDHVAAWNLKQNIQQNKRIYHEPKNKKGMMCKNPKRD